MTLLPNITNKADGVIRANIAEGPRNVEISSSGLNVENGSSPSGITSPTIDFKAE